MNKDYKSAIADLVPVYASTEDVLSVALKRQVPQPVMDEKGVQSLKTVLASWQIWDTSRKTKPI